MSSQVPFTPLTPEALSQLGSGELAAFTEATRSVADDRKPSSEVITDLLAIIQRLITRSGTEAPTPEDGPASPGRAAYEARLASEMARYKVTLHSAWGAFDDGVRSDWAAAAAAGAGELAAQLAVAERELDEARAELATAREYITIRERLAVCWTRGIYSAHIDCRRGDPKAAAATLSEGLDGYDGPEWDGTETGEQWWERTKAEEGL